MFDAVHDIRPYTVTGSLIPPNSDIQRYTAVDLALIRSGYAQRAEILDICVTD
jgi:hypothetical protein